MFQESGENVEGEVLVIGDGIGGITCRVNAHRRILVHFNCVLEFVRAQIKVGEKETAGLLVHDANGFFEDGPDFWA